MSVQQGCRIRREEDRRGYTELVLEFWRYDEITEVRVAPALADDIVSRLTGFLVSEPKSLRFEPSS